MFFQGDLIPDQPDSIAAVIVSVNDIMEVAAYNDYKLTEEQARVVLDKMRHKITDALLYDWEQAIWDACDNQIKAVGQLMNEVDE